MFNWLYIFCQRKSGNLPPCVTLSHICYHLVLKSKPNNQITIQYKVKYECWEKMKLTLTAALTRISPHATQPCWVYCGPELRSKLGMKWWVNPNTGKFIEGIQQLKDGWNQYSQGCHHLCELPHCQGEVLPGLIEGQSLVEIFAWQTKTGAVKIEAKLFALQLLLCYHNCYPKANFDWTPLLWKRNNLRHSQNSREKLSM